MLKALRSAYDDKDLVIIGVSLDQDAKVLQQMVALKGLDWPQVFDAKGFGGPVPRAFRVFGTPTYFVISRAGRIVAQNVGPRQAQGRRCHSGREAASEQHAVA